MKKVDGQCMNCSNKLCIYHRYNDVCSLPNNSDLQLGEDCPNFDYDCEICQDIGFRHFKCDDCDLTEKEYYYDEEETE